MADNYGIPALIPVQTDTIFPEAIDGDLVDMCVDERLRVVAYTDSDNSKVTVGVYLRENDYQLSETSYETSDEVLGVRVMACGRKPVVVWLRDDGRLSFISWTGSSWAGPTDITTTARTFDGVSANGTSFIVWNDEAGPGDPTLKIGQFIDGSDSDKNFDFGTTLDTDAYTPYGAVAIDVSPLGEIVVAFYSNEDGLLAGVYGMNAQLMSASVIQVSVMTSPVANGLAVAYRQLRNSAGHWPFLIYAGSEDMASTAFDPKPSTYLYEVASNDAAETGFTIATVRSTFIPNSHVDSRAFRVGDEVFCWLYAHTSKTRFLVCGVTKALRVAVADREDAISRPIAGDKFSMVSNVSRDPDVSTQLYWARKFDVGPYLFPGNGRIGHTDFLPELSTAKYGRSVYVAGSLVRNWDGYELGDAGFHDYPKFDGAIEPGGTLTDGTHLVRVYAVRYNKQGEQFRSPIVQSDEFDAAGGTSRINLFIKPVIITNHDDVKLEVYMTAADETTFYLVDRVSNDMTVEDINISLGMADATVVTGTVDPRGTTDGTEIEEFGPIGCAIITSASDRLWCAGGQVAKGTVNFSKLYEPNEGAGFDPLAGYVVADITGAPITSLIGHGDAAVIAFQEKRIFQITGPGPSNLVGEGGFGAPRLTVIDGATNHAGTISLPVGVAYWGVDGPRLMTPGGRVECISEPVVPLTKLMVPTAVKADLARREVVWYSAEGDAVLWNYSEVGRTYDAGVMAAGSRWARWANLPIAGASAKSLVTTDGRLLRQGSTPKDDGRRFEFKVATGLVRPEQLLQNYVRFRSVGIMGKYEGPHRVLIEVYYDGAPRFAQRFKWEPQTNTWLTPKEDYDAMTPEEIDALPTVDTSGAYATHHRLKRQVAKYIQVVFSDYGDQGFTPWELSFEMAVKPGTARIPPNTFTK